jgi:hypothetical protein
MVVLLLLVVDRVGCMVQVFSTMQIEASLSKCGHLSLIKRSSYLEWDFVSACGKNDMNYRMNTICSPYIVLKMRGHVRAHG